LYGSLESLKWTSTSWSFLKDSFDHDNNLFEAIRRTFNCAVKMSLSYGVGGATTALAVVGACKKERIMFEDLQANAC
jgi:hypothetical protein